MNSHNSTISTHPKGQHLALQDRVIIQVLCSQGQSLRKIAHALNCSPTTVKYEFERGQISLYHGKRYCYDAQVAQRRYQIRHLNCGRKQAFLAKPVSLSTLNSTSSSRAGCLMPARVEP